MAKRIIRSDEVKHGGGPYSQAIQAGGFVFLSGQTGVDRDGRLKEASRRRPGKRCRMSKRSSEPLERNSLMWFKFALTLQICRSIRR